MKPQQYHVYVKYTHVWSWHSHWETLDEAKKSTEYLRSIGKPVRIDEITTKTVWEGE